ncbi:MAG: hypothetical protein JW940_09755 [Polyangiaceae bacterium]|nr:hypothetical protein [Polyangiaceae bacterium]
MWKQGACLAAVASALFACSGGDRGGGDWYKQKSPPSIGAAGMEHESAGESGEGAGERPDDSGGSTGSGVEAE